MIERGVLESAWIAWGYFQIRTNESQSLGDKSHLVADGQLDTRRDSRIQFFRAKLTSFGPH